MPHHYVCPLCEEDIERDEPFFHWKLYRCPHCGDLISMEDDGILR